MIEKEVEVSAIVKTAAELYKSGHLTTPRQRRHFIASTTSTSYFTKAGHTERTEKKAIGKPHRRALWECCKGFLTMYSLYFRYTTQQQFTLVFGRLQGGGRLQLAHQCQKLQGDTESGCGQNKLPLNAVQTFPVVP